MENFKGIWERTSLVQRVLLLSIVLGLAAAGGMLVWWVRQPNLTILYAGLSPEEAAKVVEKVRDSGSAYELKNGGTTILVPDEKVYSLRLAMASQGLPKGDQAGYRILDEEKIGASPFTQRVNYMRAVEGELGKTIQLLDGVVSARVHVVKPESTLFAGKDKESSATVVVRLQNGHHLSPANVAAIVHLLAGSVEGLSADKVVVVDGQGVLLSGEGGDNKLAKKAGTFLDYKGQVEDYLARKVEDMLTAALGPNRANVKVDATIETTALTSTTETYDPEKKVITKEELKSSSTTVAASADANKANGNGGNREETSTNEYLVSKTVEEKEEVPGKVKSVTVAAFVDLSPSPDAGKDGAPPAPTLTVADVEGVILSALGPLATKENIKVVNTPFYRPAVAKDAPEEKTGNRDFYLDLASRASLGLLVVGVLLGMKILRKPAKKSAELAVAGSAPAALEGQGAAGLLSAQGENPELLRARITRALQENPEEVKRLFLSWVESDKGEI